jgi:hypothetical protein
MLSYILSRIAGKVHTNGKSVFMEYSSRDLHFSTKVTDPVDVYGKLASSQESKYLGVTLSDSFLQDWLNEFFQRRKEINVVEMLSLFPEFDTYVDAAKAGVLNQLLPDIVEKYGENSKISIILNPEVAPEEHVNYAMKSNKVVFNKEALEVVIALYLDLAIEDS